MIKGTGTVAALINISRPHTRSMRLNNGQLLLSGFEIAPAKLPESPKDETPTREKQSARAKADLPVVSIDNF